MIIQWNCFSLSIDVLPISLSMRYNSTTLELHLNVHHKMQFSHSHNSITTRISSSPMHMERQRKTSRFQAHPIRTYKWEVKIVNHGSSPPNLGLKEATPQLGETRFNQNILKQHHNNMNHHEYNNLTTHLQYMLNTTINNTIHWITKTTPQNQGFTQRFIHWIKLKGEGGLSQWGEFNHDPHMCTNLQYHQSPFEAYY